MSWPPELRALHERRPRVAEAMAPWWSAGVAAYSAALWRPPPDGTIEPALVSAFAAELARVGRPEVLPELLRRRVVATAHHITPTNGPTFLSLDAILTASGQRGVVAAYSGVAFSNTAWSGALSFAGDPTRIIQPGTATARRFVASAASRQADAGPTEHRLTLIPSRWRDGLLYRHPLPADLSERLADLQPAVSSVLGEPGEDWPTWALQGCAAIQRAVLGRDVAYLDLNRVVSRYLVAVLGEPGHPLRRLLCSPAVRQRMLERSPRPWFYARRHRKKAEKVDLLRPEGDWLVGRGEARIRLEPGTLAEALSSGVLCPGLMLCFAALGILSPIRCLGSFNQIAYQASFSEDFSAAGLVETPADPGPVLLTGRLLVAGAPVYPLDRFVDGQCLPDLSEVPMSRLWTPIVERLLR